MLVIIMILMIGATFFIALNRRDTLSGYMCGMCASFVVMFSGVLTYIAKMGGFSESQRVLLFLLPSLQQKLQYLAVPLGRIGYAVAIGRSLFPCFLLIIALEYSMIGPVRRHLRVLKLLALLCPLCSLIYYFPPVFRAATANRFWLLLVGRRVGLCWIAAYVAVAIGLMIVEYVSTTIPFCKRNFRFILLSQISITVLYGMYAVQDPGQIYNMFVSEYVRLGSLSYIKSSLSGYGWVGVALCTVFFVVLGTINLVSYTKIGRQENREDIRLQRRFDATSLGATMFIHGMKNQLLSSRVLHKKIAAELQRESPGIEELRAQTERLCELNEGMLARMDELYRAVKSNALTLRPVPVREIIAAATARFAQKYPEQSVDIIFEDSGQTVLADSPSLAEALCNLMANGYEAALLAAADKICIELIVHNERLYTGFEVRDNGCGIPKERQDKIFEPFFTSKNTSHSWGMGLYYVRKTVKGHVGMLRVESEQGVGTSFFVMLPKLEANTGFFEYPRKLERQKREIRECKSKGQQSRPNGIRPTRDIIVD